jgi:hypothetical protein
MCFELGFDGTKIKRTYEYFSWKKSNPKFISFKHVTKH